MTVVASRTLTLRFAPNYIRRLITDSSMAPAIAVDVLFGGYLLLIAGLRWQVIASYPEPSGVDGGNWLALGHSLLGSHSLTATNVYPPLTPLLTVGLAAIWGPLLGAQIMALVSSLMPALGVYIATRRVLGIRAALLAGLLAPAGTTGEAAAWGGYPQLLSLGFLPILLMAVDQAFRRRNLSWALISSLFLFLIIATNELIGLIAIAATFVVIAARLTLTRRLQRPSTKRLIVGLVLGVLPLLALVPLYYILTSAFVHNDAIPGSNQHVSASKFLSIFENTFKDNVGLWFVLALVALCSPLVLLRRSRASRARTALAIGSTALLIPTIGSIVVFQNIRFLYLVPTAVVLAAGAWWSLLSSRRASFVARSLDRLLLAAMCVVLAIESALGLALFDSQERWYYALSPGVVEGLTVLNRIAPKTAVLSVGPAASEVQDGRPWGWWVEGLLDRPTYYSSSLIWVDLPADRQRVVVANEMFDPSVGVTRAIGVARSNGIDYLVVATGWPGYRAWVSNGGSLDGARVVVETESILVISTRG
jgi:hypothetical protein